MTVFAWSVSFGFIVILCGIRTLAALVKMGELGQASRIGGEGLLGSL